jgi:hypothetical protein
MDAANLATIDRAKASASAAARGVGDASSGAGTTAGAAPNLVAQAAQAAALAAQNQFTVAGVEVILERTDGQRFLRVFSVKD